MGFLSDIFDAAVDVVGEAAIDTVKGAASVAVDVATDVATTAIAEAGGLSKGTVDFIKGAVDGIDDLLK